MKIVALSDQHGTLPDVPECDLLLVAGDQCPDYPASVQMRIGSGPQVDQQERWFREIWLPWRHRQPVGQCFLTWGNHDYVGERLHGRDGTHVVLDRTTIAVVDGLVEWGGLKIWLTPWSSQFRDWAFMQEEDRLADLYRPIPVGVDLIVSHQPPYGVCDEGAFIIDPVRGSYKERVGSKAFERAVRDVRPKAVVCGHIHDGHGTGVMYHYDEKWNGGNPGMFRTGSTAIHNVSVLNGHYEPTWGPTVIEIPV